MITRGQAILQLLNQPKYENTKNSTGYERSILLTNKTKLLQKVPTNKNKSKLIDYNYKRQYENYLTVEQVQKVDQADKVNDISKWLDSIEENVSKETITVNPESKVFEQLKPAYFLQEKVIRNEENIKNALIKESIEMGYHVATDLHNNETEGTLVVNIGNEDHQNISGDTLISKEDFFLPSPSEYFPSDIESGDYDIYQNIGKSRKTIKKRQRSNQQNTPDPKQLKIDSNIVTINNEPKSKDEDKLSELDSDEEGVYITAAQKKSNSALLRNKKYCCLYCHKFVSQMAKHLEATHNSEIEVARVLALPKKSKQRRDEFSLLLRVGNDYHNCEVLTCKKGELILVRRPSEEEAKSFLFTDYGPCPDCLGFTPKKHLWHHVKYGCKKPTLTNTGTFRRNYISESAALLVNTINTHYSSEFFKDIIDKLRSDNISLVCKQDKLILRFAYMQFEKYHCTQNELIRQSIRQLGRLLYELRIRDHTKNNLRDWLSPEYFDTIIDAVRKVCSFQDNGQTRPTYSVPSLALKLGYSIKKCLNILKGITLRKADIQMYDNINRFLELMNIEWASKISSNALATFESRKINTVELLPITEDLRKLNTYLNEAIDSLSTVLKNSCNYLTWNRLATVVLAKMILFNKRRSGESAKMKIDQYSHRPNWSQIGTEEFKNSMSDMEKDLAAKLSLVQIRGKRGRTVNVLLTKDVQNSIDLLISKRKEANILENNEYVFARGNGLLQYIRGHDAIRKCASTIDLKQPELMNGTKFRKYVATVCQVFNLTENETDWLARHLGHDIRVHREFYRLHESSVELTKVSRILLAIESGEAHKFKGKQLSEINIKDLPDIQETEIKDDQVDSGEDSTDDDNGEELPKNIKLKNKKILQKRKARQKWSNDEVEKVLQFFRKEIKEKLVPGKEKCIDCKTKNDVLSNRSWTDIKFCVYNYIKKIK